MERLPGFRDFYPYPVPPGEAWSYESRRHIEETWAQTARSFGFFEYDGPPLEPLELYTLKSGDEIVGQLYNFQDKGERDISLRPEMTPTLVRMAAARERNYKKPLKWFSTPQLFRYERQQKGRLREHIQFNADILGESDLSADAELITLLVHSLRRLGLTEEDFVVRLSSRNAWNDYFHERSSNSAHEYSFYQIIDKMERESPDVTKEKLQQIGFDADEVRSFIAESRPTSELQTLLSYLDDRGIGNYVKLDYNVIRGLAYYTGPVFEAFDRKGEFRAIAGGGRYDHLLKLITKGKQDMPALGFGMGDVVLTELLKSRGRLPEASSAIDVYVLIEDESRRKASLEVANTLRLEKINVEYALTPSGGNKQFKKAKELKARFTLKLDGEATSATYFLKRLETGDENRYDSLDSLKAALNAHCHP